MTKETEIGLLRDYLTEEDLAAQLGKKPRTLRDWRQNRCGPPFIKMGIDTLYFKASVLKWLQLREQQPLLSKRVALKSVK